MIKKISKVIKNKFKKLFKITKFKKSYAQSGEDMILNTILNNIKKGVYIDVGANDPYFQSNTHFFYELGWQGINIDANPESIRKLNKTRKRDINIEALISNKDTKLKYFFYENSAYNGVVYNENIPSKLKYSKTIKSKTLSDVLNNKKVITIDFLSIDAEGHDFEVLLSIDLKKYRPKAIVVESFADNITNDLNSKIATHLNIYNYVLFSRTVTNSIYISDEFRNDRFKI